MDADEMAALRAAKKELRDLMNKKRSEVPGKSVTQQCKWSAKSS